MSTRTALNHELIMRQIAERHPSHAQSTSPLMTHSDTTAPFLHESARAVALSTVDREIDSAILLTRTLLTRRNTLAPVSVLPLEVLSRIFHIVAFAEWPWFRMENFRWIGVTQVCRHWRQVALDDSSLWARISGYRSTAWISEMLARARNAPLTVDFCGTPNAETLAMLTAHFVHTHEFRLRGLGTPHFGDGVQEICSLEAPAMEHFELSSISLASPITFLRAPFFKRVAPKLRTFTLSQVRVPWSFIPCGQLTQLKITLLGRSIADGPSLGDSKSLIDLLINCPVLEILVLGSCLPHDITRPHVQAIHLPRLSYLSLGGVSSRVTNLLKILKLPPSTTLHMRCTSENTATHNDHHLLPLVSAHFHDPASVEMKYFGVTFYPMDHFIKFVAYTHLPISDVNGVAALALSFGALPEVDDGVDILGRVCSMLPISNIEYLFIGAPDMDGSVNWGELFQHCAKLTTIEATGHGTSGLLKGLTPPKPKKAPSDGKGRKKKLDNRGVPAPASSSNAATSGTPVPIFPKLTSLFLSDLGFGEPGRPKVLYDALSATLRLRRACKVPLRVLRIERCLITTNRANALGKLVPEFLWNGQKGA
ncbi:hypothetical protein BC826DRAFT_1180853 [Russula brevipes]|nr:hypothetical protein BC826DRAFT_1180853 [Russula brevipes]